MCIRDRYAFFDVYWNGVLYPGGNEAGMNAFSQEMAWNIESTVDGYLMSFYDESENPKTLDSEDLPGTLTIKFRPSLLIGSKFCSTTGSTNPTDTPCGC